MEMQLSDAAAILRETEGQFRPLKRLEFEFLASKGYFDDERVELLCGVVVPMAPIDQDHNESVAVIHDVLVRQLGRRARVYGQSSFAASDESEPQPDIFVAEPGRHWGQTISAALLVIEVARSSLRRDRAKGAVYARAEVHEYWIVNHAEQCVEVYRDRRDGAWQSMTTHRRGEAVSPLAFPDVTIAIDDILPPLA